MNDSILTLCGNATGGAAVKNTLTARTAELRNEKTLPVELIQLPHRTLFQNEFVSLVLAGLKCRQELLFLRAPLMLLTVTCGRVRLLGAEGFITLHEGGQRRLEQGAHWQVQALSEADLLFFIPAVKADA